MRLIQHDYLDDPWKMMVACMLLNQTTGTAVRPVLPELFDMFPNACDMAAANVGDIFPIIGHLGFGNRRSMALVKMSLDACHGKVVGNWHGIGQYAVDSWMMFVVGMFVEPDDKELRAYHDWAKKAGVLPPAYQTDNIIYRHEPLRIMRLTKEMIGDVW